MSDVTAETTEVVETSPTDEVEPVEAAERPNDIASMESALRRANEQAKKYRLQAKEADELRKRVAEFEDASKSESEKAAARAEAAEKALAEVTAKALRLELADELSVPKELRKFLTATDEDSLRSQAEELLSAFTAATASTRTSPRPDPTQGAKPASATGQLTQADAERMTPAEIVAAKAAGRFNDLLGIKT